MIFLRSTLCSDQTQNQSWQTPALSNETVPNNCAAVFAKRFQSAAQFSQNWVGRVREPVKTSSSELRGRFTSPSPPPHRVTPLPPTFPCRTHFWLIFASIFALIFGCVCYAILSPNRLHFGFILGPKIATNRNKNA